MVSVWLRNLAEVILINYAKFLQPDGHAIIRKLQCDYKDLQCCDFSVVIFFSTLRCNFVLLVTKKKFHLHVCWVTTVTKPKVEILFEYDTFVSYYILY